MEVQIIGQRELINALENVARKDVLRAADRGLKAAGMNIIADAQLNLRRNHTNTTGRLSQSGKVQKAEDGYDVGFMMGEENYAGAVEYGRRPGKPAPYRDIRAWLMKKNSGLRGRPDAAGLTSAAIAISKSIGKHGTKGQPFFEPAVRDNQAKIANTVRTEIQKVINRDV